LGEARQINALREVVTQQISALSSGIQAIDRRLLWFGRKPVATPPREWQRAAAITFTSSPA